jgi:dsDNA-specific endonuclease/ATPase MutS2
MTTIKNVIYSNLEDIKFENGMPSSHNHVTARANFIKWLLMKYKDITQEIDADEEYTLFSRLHPALLN